MKKTGSRIICSRSSVQTSSEKEPPEATSCDADHRKMACANSPSEKKDWLKLHLLAGIPVSLKRRLVADLGTPSRVFEQPTDELAERHGLNPAAIAKIKKCADSEAETELNNLEKLGGDFIDFLNPRFPPLLNEIADPPLGIYAQGNISLLSEKQIAVVGSRQASRSGYRTAKSFARALCQHGLVITSGMAEGIDQGAHMGCLEAGHPTVAIIATGLDQVYPRSHRDLQAEIADAGVVATEFPLRTPPTRNRFPQRNRIISGLSLGVLIIEASLRSGSLITARLAGEQGREVFAVPGSIHSAVSRGCHKLIKEGAKLVEDTDDIICELPVFDGISRPCIMPDEPPAHPETLQNNPVYALIDFTPIGLEELIQLSGLTAVQVSSMLLALDLDGYIEESAEGYRRTGK